MLPTLATQDRSESETDKVKSALILCYGHVAARAPPELLLARVESDILRNMFQCFSTKAGARAVRVGASHQATVRLTLLFVVQVLGVKVETKVQCAGVTGELHLPSLLWAVGSGRACGGAAAGHLPGLLGPVQGEGVEELPACPHVLRGREPALPWALGGGWGATGHRPSPQPLVLMGAHHEGRAWVSSEARAAVSGLTDISLLEPRHQPAASIWEQPVPPWVSWGWWVGCRASLRGVPFPKPLSIRALSHTAGSAQGCGGPQAWSRQRELGASGAPHRPLLCPVASVIAG